MTRRLPALLAAMDVSAETNRRQRQEAFRILHIAIEKELTPRQRDCLLLYYRDQLTMQAIARELGLTKGHRVQTHSESHGPPQARRKIRTSFGLSPCKGDWDMVVFVHTSLF